MPMYNAFQPQPTSTYIMANMHTAHCTLYTLSIRPEHVGGTKVPRTPYLTTLHMPRQVLAIIIPHPTPPPHPSNTHRATT